MYVEMLDSVVDSNEFRRDPDPNPKPYTESIQVIEGMDETGEADGPIVVAVRRVDRLVAGGVYDLHGGQAKNLIKRGFARALSDADIEAHKAARAKAIQDEIAKLQAEASEV